MAERRRSDRYKYTLPVDLHERGGSRRLDAVDVGRHGFFVRTDTPPQERLLLQLTVHLPEGAIAILAAVVRRALPRTAAAARLGPGAGLQFFALAPAAKDRWDRFIGRLRGDGKLPPEQRAHTRYAASFLVKLKNVERLRDLYTRDISEGGMFLATPVLQEIGTEVALVVVHPDSEEEFELGGAVARLQESSPKGMGIRLHLLGEEQRDAFRRFVETGISALHAPALEEEEPAEDASELILHEESLEQGGGLVEELSLDDEEELDASSLVPVDDFPQEAATVETTDAADGTYLELAFPGAEAKASSKGDETAGNDELEFDLVDGPGPAPVNGAPAATTQSLPTERFFIGGEGSAAGPVPAAAAEASPAAGAAAAALGAAGAAAPSTIDAAATPEVAAKAAPGADEAAGSDATERFAAKEPAAGSRATERFAAKEPAAGADDVAGSQATERFVAKASAASGDDVPGTQATERFVAKAPVAADATKSGAVAAPVAAGSTKRFVAPPRATTAPAGGVAPEAPKQPRPPRPLGPAPKDLVPLPAGLIPLPTRSGPASAPPSASTDPGAMALVAEIGRRPEVIEPRLRLATLLIGLGRPSEGVLAAEGALELHPKHPIALVALSRALAACGRFGDAEAALKRARKAGHLGDDGLAAEIARGLGR